MPNGSSRTLLTAAVLLFAAAASGRAQTVDPTLDPEPNSPAALASEADAAAEALRLRRTLSPDGIEQSAADPYPVGDAIDPPSLPEDPFAAAPVSAPVLRPSTGEVAPLRTVVRPVDRTARPALPITGAGPEPRDLEADARAEYQPLGLRLGSFDVFAVSTAAIGWTSNGSGTAGGGESAYGRTRGELVARSDWERHGLDVTLRGGQRRLFEGDAEFEPDADVTVNGRLDLTEVDRVGASAAWTWRREDASSAELGTSATGADVHTLSGSLGYERSAGLIGLGLKGAVDRTFYEEGDSRTNTALSGSLRLSLDSGATVEPFVEGGTFARLYDDRTDAGGFRRSSVGGELKAGFAVDTGLVTGEAAVGYAMESPDDSRLPDLRGVIGEVSLAWAATPLTTVTLKGDTAFEPSQLAGATGSVVYAVDLDATYALRPNLLLGAGAGFSWQDYAGVAREVATTELRAGAAWKLNRSLELGLTASHTVTDSSVAGEDETETVVEASVTLRR